MLMSNYKQLLFTVISKKISKFAKAAELSLICIHESDFNVKILKLLFTIKLYYTL